MPLHSSFAHSNPPHATSSSRGISVGKEIGERVSPLFRHVRLRCSTTAEKFTEASPRRHWMSTTGRSPRRNVRRLFPMRAISQSSGTDNPTPFQNIFMHKTAIFVDEAPFQNTRTRRCRSNAALRIPDFRFLIWASERPIRRHSSLWLLVSSHLSADFLPDASVRHRNALVQRHPPMSA